MHDIIILCGWCTRTAIVCIIVLHHIIIITHRHPCRKIGHTVTRTSSIWRWTRSRAAWAAPRWSLVACWGRCCACRRWRTVVSRRCTWTWLLGSSGATGPRWSSLLCSTSLRAKVAWYYVLYWIRYYNNIINDVSEYKRWSTINNNIIIVTDIIIKMYNNIMKYK